MKKAVAAASPDPSAETSAGTSRKLPGPFLKWAGGKRQLLPVILDRLPRPITGRYIEPFVGGGAVFFELVRLGWVTRARLSDRNEELVRTYVAVRDRVDRVLKALEAHRNEEAYFYDVRAQNPRKLSDAAAAARTIYLNRVGFNGLYRVNSKGLFNVPFGRYANPKMRDVVGLKAASAALSIAEIVASDFAAATADVGGGDVVYFDPPYVPLTKTANFTAYAKDAFGDAEHVRLAETFAGVVDSGGYALLSNSDTERTRALYAKWDIATVEATRRINSKVEGRGVVDEILVRGIAG